MRRMSLPGKNKTYLMNYEGFLGADFTGSPSNINRLRSGNCLNVYKDYYGLSPDVITTRKGLRKIFHNNCTAFTVGAMHNMMPFGEEMYLHFGAYLMKYDNFPDDAVFVTPTVAGMSGCSILGSSMNTKDGGSFVFKDNLYSIDGRKYMFLDKDGRFGFVSPDCAYIPTSRINAYPDGSGGVIYQEENVLTSFRRNSFLSDGESLEYILDGTGIDADSVQVTVDGEEVYDFTVNAASGIVIFDSPPPRPVTAGADNVIITFSDNIDRTDRIDKCTVCKVFDNRVFLTGNPDYPGLIFHSEFEDATYFALSSYYDDGEDGIRIKSLITAGGCLIAVKENAGNGSKVFIHTPSVDYEMGKVYPVTDTNIYSGAEGPGINFNDEMLYLSGRGLEALSVSDNRFSLSHRSLFIDGRLAKYSREAIRNAKMFSWQNYLMLIVDGDVFLADSNCVSKAGGDYQYEWYFWQFDLKDNEKIIGGLAFDGNLYFTGSLGNIYVYDGKTDDGNNITSYWQTPKDYLGTESCLKSFRNKGSFIRCRLMKGAKVTVSADTDRHKEKIIGTFSLNPFDFGNVDFSSFNFYSSKDTIIDIRPSMRRFRHMSFKFSSDDAPFNISGITGEFNIKQYD